MTGELCRWLLTEAESEGRLARAVMSVSAGCAETLHAHPDSEERLEVLEGVLALEAAGRRTALRAGDCATGPAGVIHAWSNAGAGRLRFVVEMEPGHGFEAAVAAFLRDRR